MKAEDTVKTFEELTTFCQHKFGGDFKPTEQDRIKAQAKISFKAGIREVVSRVSRIHSSTSDLKEIEKRIVAMLNEYHKEWGV